MTAENLCGGKPKESVLNIVAIHLSNVDNSVAEITTSCWLLKVKPLVIRMNCLESHERKKNSATRVKPSSPH